MSDLMLPFPKARNILELLTLNVGEGAFNWVRCHHANACAGWIYDCGTRSGKSKIKSSVSDVIQAIKKHGSPISLMMISHYHSDHLSHLRYLNDIPLYRHDHNFWIPEIDPYSMALYLRILAFSTLFKFRNAEIADKELNRVFSKPGHLRTDISKWFNISEEKIRMVKSGDEDRCPRGNNYISVRALTPPSFEGGKKHPLAEDVDAIAFMLSDLNFFRKIETIMQQMIREIGDRRDFKDYIYEFWGPDHDFLLDGLARNVLDAMRYPPLKEEQFSEENLLYTNVKLHMWLAVSLFANKSPKLSISGKESSLPPSYKDTLKYFPKVISNATHLFNLVVEISDGSCSYLLTGDADVRLWPEILSHCSQTQTAIQVAHHGSSENVFYPAFHQLNCQNYVVSADKFKNWKHPSIRLGMAVSGSGGQLYCTNDHSNCEINETAKGCRRKVTLPIRAISVTPDNVEWIVKGYRNPAEKCPSI